jgi:hypothetical protein
MEGQQEQVVVHRRIIQRVIQTDAQIVEGNLELDCLVQEQGEPVQRTFIIEAPGQDLLKNVLLGGLSLPSDDEVKEHGGS